MRMRIQARWRWGALAVALALASVRPAVAAEVTIEADADDDRSFQQTGAAVVFTTDQVGYAFYQQEGVTFNGTLRWAKTSDGGATWGSETTVDTDEQTAGFGIWYDQWTPGDTTGTNIYVAYWKRSTDDVHIYILDTFDDSATTPNFIVNASVNPQDGRPYIAKSTDDDLYVFADANIRDVWRSADGGSTWNSTSATFLNDDTEQGNLMPLSGGDILFTYLDCPCDIAGNPYTIKSRVLDDTGAGQGTWDIADLTVGTIILHDVVATSFSEDTFWGASLNKTTGDVYLAISSNPNDPGIDADIETYLYDEGLRTWSQKTNILTNNQDGLRDAKISLDSCGNIYAIYVRDLSPNGNVYYKQSTDGMTTWGTEQAISDSSGDYDSVRPNLINNERLYALWHDENGGIAPRNVLGDTIIDLSGSCSDVTVSTSGTQTADILIPSTNEYVGGKFIITETTSSRNVTGITITEGGTVDALVDLDNIKLFYELDTTAPYDGASVSFDGTETQFGSTAAFTGTVGITTTATMVVYVVFDVGSGATDGETAEISIADSSTEVVVSGAGSGRAQYRGGGSGNDDAFRSRCHGEYLGNPGRQHVDPQHRSVRRWEVRHHG